MTSKNDRAYPRYDVKLDGIVTMLKGGTAAGLVEDVCLGGLFFSFYQQPVDKQLWRTGEKVEVRFPNAASSAERNYVITGQVARVVEMGVGIAFDKPDRAAVQYLMVRSQSTGKPDVRPISAPTDTRYITLAASCREKTRVFIEQLVENFVQNAIVTLERSDEITKKNWRGLLEAQQRLRGGQQQLTRCFTQAIMDEFSQQGKPLKQQKGAVDDADELTLVADDEFQNWLTVSVLVTKLDASHEELQYGLEQRLGMVFNRQLERQNNPVGPTQLVNRFQQCFDPLLPDDAQIKPLAFKSFETVIQGGVFHFYEQLNKFLVDQGVMPKLKKDLKVVRPTGGASHHPAVAAQPTVKDIAAALGVKAGEGTDAVMTHGVPISPAAAASVVGASSFSAASELLQLERSAQHGGESEVQVSPGTHYTAQEMNYALSQLQQMGMNIRQLRQQGQSLAARLSQVIAEQGGDPSKQLPQEAQDRLEITESLLSSIQSDPIVSTGLKGWFEHVELPIAQVALNNAQVLHDQSHPVHQLFNTMDQLFQILPESKAGLRQELVGKAEKALQSLSEKPGGDPTLLADAVDSVNKAYGEQSEEYRQKVEAVVARCKAEPNHRQMTLELLEDVDRLFDLEPERMIPRVVLELFDAGWKNLLWRYCLKEGIYGEGYNAARATMEQLLMRLQGKKHPGLKADWPNHKLVEEVSKLLALLNKSDTKSLVLVSDMISALELAKEDPSKVERHHKESMSKYMLETWASETAAMKPVELSKVEWKRWLERAKALADGELISFKGDSAEPLQQKLIWADRKWGRYVFVDHEGNKSLDIRPEEMAAHMSKGRLLILEGWDRPLMDRATYTMLQSIHDRLIEQTNHDALTGLLNRRGFESALDALLVRAKKQDSKNILVYLDLDRFNVVNVTCGHEAGDELLGSLSGILRKSVGNEVVIARLGGDEFGVLLENHDRAKGMKKTEAIHDAISKFRFKCENKEFTIDASFGVAEIDAQADSVRTLLAAVDSACFAAKEAGRGRIQFYDAGSEVIRKRQGIMDWVGRINKLFEAGLIQLKCQKMVSLKYAHERPRYEVLLNVFNEEGDLVSLDQFVLSAEIYNRILDIDKFVVDKVFEWIHNHRPVMNKLGSLSINLSGHSLDNEEFMESLVQRMERVEVPSHQICFEITETAAISNLERATLYMRRLRQAGCMLALDDFGAGHASYSYLKSMPIDFLKIDGQFIRNIGTNVFDFSVVKSIHEMSRALGKRTVAEFVESEVALDKLRKIGVDYGQGYVIEKPIPIDQLAVEYK